LLQQQINTRNERANHLESSTQTAESFLAMHSPESTTSSSSSNDAPAPMDLDLVPPVKDTQAKDKQDAVRRAAIEQQLLRFIADTQAEMTQSRKS